MFLRKLEKGECPEHQGKWKCRTARLMECDECHTEFIIHGETAAAQASYCSAKCGKKASDKNYKHGEEVRKKWNRIKYGRASAFYSYRTSLGNIPAVYSPPAPPMP
jgi:hypothetical protein